MINLLARVWRSFGPWGFRSIIISHGLGSALAQSQHPVKSSQNVHKGSCSAHFMADTLGDGLCGCKLAKYIRVLFEHKAQLPSDHFIKLR